MLHAPPQPSHATARPSGVVTRCPVPQGSLAAQGSAASSQQVTEGGAVSQSGWLVKRLRACGVRVLSSLPPPPLGVRVLRVLGLPRPGPRILPFTFYTALSTTRTCTRSRAVAHGCTLCAGTGTERGAPRPCPPGVVGGRTDRTSQPDPRLCLQPKLCSPSSPSCLWLVCMQFPLLEHSSFSRLWPIQVLLRPLILQESLLLPAAPAPTHKPIEIPAPATGSGCVL